MRTTQDALRSLARYMSEAFPDFSVGFFNEEGTFARPAVAVRTTGPTLSSGSRHTVDLIQPTAIYVYPAEEESVEATFAKVMAIEDTLWRTFHVGVSAGRPMRIPLYDYEGVPLEEGSMLRRYPDYLRVVDLSIDRAQAPEDEMKWTVIAEARLTWRRAAEVPSGTRLAGDIRTDFTPS